MSFDLTIRFDSEKSREFFKDWLNGQGEQDMSDSAEYCDGCKIGMPKYLQQDDKGNYIFEKGEDGRKKFFSLQDDRGNPMIYIPDDED